MADVQSHFQPLCCFSFLLVFVAGHMLEWCLCTLTVANSTNESYSKVTDATGITVRLGNETLVYNTTELSESNKMQYLVHICESNSDL